MSRSRRRNPVVTEQQRAHNVKRAKRLASKYVRNAWDIPDGRWYRKLFDRWNICDYKFRGWRRPLWGTWSKGDRRWWAK